MLDAARRTTFLGAPRAAVVGALAVAAAAAWLPFANRPLSPDEGGFFVQYCAAPNCASESGPRVTLR